MPDMNYFSHSAGVSGAERKQHLSRKAIFFYGTVFRLLLLFLLHLSGSPVEDSGPLSGSLAEDSGMRCVEGSTCNLPTPGPSTVTTNPSSDTFSSVAAAAALPEVLPHTRHGSIGLRASFHRAFAPFAECVGPAHSNVHPDNQGLPRTLRADAIPQRSGVAGDSSKTRGCEFWTRSTEQPHLWRFNRPSHTAAHARRCRTYAREREQCQPGTARRFGRQAGKLGALGEGSRPLPKVERCPGTEGGLRTAFRLSCGIPDDAPILVWMTPSHGANAVEWGPEC
eukprot:365903-Chlamydomonas_euryale.AAC.7